MTYTVSAICMTPENDGGPTFGSEGPHMLRGVGSLITGGTVTTFNKVSDFNFIPAGYLDLDPASIDSTTLIFAPFIFLTAVNGNICLTVSLGISATSSKISYVTSVKKLQNNTATTYELANGWGDKTTEAHSDTPIWAPVSLFASGGAFYMLCLEILSSVEGQFFVVKTSSDGVSWTTLSKSGNVGNDPVAEAFFSSAGGAVLRLFGARTPISGKYFLGMRESGKLMYTFNQGNSWIDHPIGRFDGLDWYSDNGVMYLCAVRVGSNGCHGTKICDESGNMFPIEWRESAIPWNPSKTRLDAGYLAGSGFIGRPKPKPVIPVFDTGAFTREVMALTPTPVPLGTNVDDITVLSNVVGMYEGKGIALFEVTKEPIIYFGARYKTICFSTETENSVMEVFDGGRDFTGNNLKFEKTGNVIDGCFYRMYQGFVSQRNYWAVLVENAQIGDSVKVVITDSPDEPFSGWSLGSGEALPSGDNITYFARVNLDLRDFITLSDPWIDGSPDNGRTFSYFINDLACTATIMYTERNILGNYGLTYMVKCVF